MNGFEVRQDDFGRLVTRFIDRVENMLQEGTGHREKQRRRLKLGVTLRRKHLIIGRIYCHAIKGILALFATTNEVWRPSNGPIAYKPFESILHVDSISSMLC